MTPEELEFELEYNAFDEEVFYRTNAISQPIFGIIPTPMIDYKHKAIEQIRNERLQKLKAMVINGHHPTMQQRKEYLGSKNCYMRMKFDEKFVEICRRHQLSENPNKWTNAEITMVRLAVDK